MKNQWKETARMSEQNSRFLPEHVDEQVEALSQVQRGTKQGRSASARLVAHLHQAYQEEAEIGEQVWARLARYAGERQGSGALTPEASASVPSSPNAASGQRFPVNQHRLFSTPSGEKSSMNPLDQQLTQPFPLQREAGPFQEAMPRFERMSGMQQRAGVSTPGKRLSRFLSLVAALVVGAVLISSMALIFTMVKGHIPNTGTGSSAPTPQGVYVSSKQGLFRLDPQTQQIVWRQPLKNEGIAQILPAGNMVYVSQHSKQQPVVALDAKSGKILWAPALELPSAGDVGGLVLSDGRLYVQTTELIYAFNALNGKQLAVYPGGDDLAVGDGILATSSNHGLQVYNLTSTVSWSKQFGAPAEAFSLSIVNHLLYAIVESDPNDLVGQGQSYIIAYKISTGEEVWKSPIFHVDGLQGFTVEQNSVYFGTLVTNVQGGSWTGSVYAYDIQKNQLLWSKPVDGGVQSTPVISAGTVYITTDGSDGEHPAHVIALAEATGTIKWQQTLTNHLADNFCMSNGVIYVANVSNLSQATSSDGLYALDAVNGSKLWEDTQIGSPTAVVPTA
jgi:outer membrane protein assembly factor BamB